MGYTVLTAKMSGPYLCRSAILRQSRQGPGEMERKERAENMGQDGMNEKDQQIEEFGQVTLGEDEEKKRSIS